MKRRPNLEIRTRAFVTRILFEGDAGRRRGVPDGRTVRAGEVILCGGSINSPQLLQLSGVGNAAELAALGVDVVHDLPGVGENLQDHLEVYIQYACTQPVSMQPHEVAQPALDRRAVAVPRPGPARPTTSRRGGFARSNDDVAYPNLMFHFLPIAVRYDGSAPAGGHGYQVHVGPMYSDARRLGEDQEHATPGSTRRCGSTTCPPSRTAGSGWRRSGWPATS